MTKTTFIALALAVLKSVNVGTSQSKVAVPKQMTNHFKLQNKHYQQLNKANYRNQRKRK